MAKEQSKNHDGRAGALFVACMFLGLGIGMLFNKAFAGTVIGVGIGFLAMYIAKRK